MSFLVNPFWYASAGCADADANAFLTAAGITDPTITSAICTLVTSMKANGTWAKCNAIYPMVGGTATTHKFNLKNPLDTNAAFRLSFVGGWTHSTNGALPNGTNSYANTFFSPNANSIIANNNHISYYSRTSAAGSNALNQYYEIGMSGVGGADIFALFARRQGDTAAYDCGIFTNNRNTVTNLNGQGFYLGKTNNDLTSKFYKSNSLIGTKSITAQNLANVNVYLGGFNDQNTLTYFSNKQCAFSSIGSGFTDTEAASLYTNVQAFNTTLGRQV